MEVMAMEFKLRLCNPKVYSIMLVHVLLSLGRGIEGLGLGKVKIRKTAKLYPKGSNHQSSITSPKGSTTLGWKNKNPAQENSETEITSMGIYYMLGPSHTSAHLII